MTHAVDVRRRERVAEPQKLAADDAAWMLERALSELLRSVDVTRTRGSHRFWFAYEAALAALNAYREGKR
jgi:hypothetical protein